jgi:tetratricopeptide (TPR) repeat protein
MTDLRDQLQATLGTAYTLERELGGGGMSRVFVADEVRFRRKVVVKVLSPDLFEGISAERFEREIQLAASLQQANIVPVLNAGDAGGMPYYTMPFVDGESLRARLARGPLPMTEVLSILRDVARALAYAHERGIVHRDIKPDNVLLSRGTAVVTDFGIAKALAASQTRAGSATLTMTGVAIGTPAYMAPEQAAGDPDIDHRADIYAFGCMAYEVLTGAPPFGGRAPQKMLTAHLTETAPPVTDLRVDTPTQLANLIAQCLAKDAQARPQSADELLGMLESMSTGEGTRANAPAMLLAKPGMLGKALAAYVVAFVVVAIVARAAITGIGLPDWVFPGALIVMALGLPVILFTAYAQYMARRAIMRSPTLTPGGTAHAAPQGTMATIAMKASPHVSWRRTGIGGAVALGAFVLVVGAFMVLRAAGIGPAGSLFAAGRLNARDLLIVTDFRVKGADSSLGPVVSEAVRTELSQSNVLSIMSPTRVAAALQRMRRPSATAIDLPLAREVAQREGAKAVVDGDVTPLGAGFVVSLRLVTADSGAELASFHGTADGPKDLLATLDKLTRDLRGRIGESLKRVHADPPLEQVTTSSLEALRKFAESRRANNVTGDVPRAIQLSEEAVALDTTFAMAYRGLGLVYGNALYPREKVDSAFARAYRYRDRLTERERYLATADYYGGPGHDRGRQIAAMEDYLAQYPHDFALLNNLAEAYASRRAFTRAESLYRKSIAEDSGTLQPHMNLILNLLSQGRVSAADSVRRVFARRIPGAPMLPFMRDFVLEASGPSDSLLKDLRITQSTAPRAMGQARAMEAIAQVLLVRGQVAEAEKAAKEMRSIDAARGAGISPFDPALDAALHDAWFFGRAAQAASRLDSALAAVEMRALPLSERRYFELATTYALAGRPDRARAMIAAFDSDVRDTTLRRASEPQRHWAMSEIAIAEHRARDAIAEIRKADTLPDGPADDCARCTYAALARAYDLAEMPDSAIVMFERYLATPYWQPSTPRADGLHLAGTYKRLGELYEAKGDREKAVSNYLKFVALWKDADPELQPKVAEVRRRLARLSDVERR